MAMAALAGALAHAADAGASREPAARRAIALVVRARAAVAAAGGRSNGACGACGACGTAYAASGDAASAAHPAAFVALVGSSCTRNAFVCAFVPR